MQLAALLRGEDLDVGDPTIIAARGWTTDELSAGIDRANPQGPYDLVSLLIGVNNQYRGRSPDEYREEFAALLRRALAFAGENPAHVVVLSIPDWGVTPFAGRRDPVVIATAIDAFNTINREESERVGARYVDVAPISRKAAHDPSLIADDGLHPSGKMYAEWARLALPAAREALAGLPSVTL